MSIAPAERIAESQREPLDQRVLLHNLSWEDYTQLREIIGDAVRLTYLRGTLEIMSPSSAHEVGKTLLARLLELYGIERDVPLDGGGSTTFRRKHLKAGLEPDECYFVGRTFRDEALEVPDIAIEVALTSGGIDKLAIYRELGVREVWFWRNARLEIHALEPGGYRVVPHSPSLPGLDVGLLAEFARRAGSHHEIVLAYRDRLRADAP